MRRAPHDDLLPSACTASCQGPASCLQGKSEQGCGSKPRPGCGGLIMDRCGDWRWERQHFGDTLGLVVDWLFFFLREGGAGEKVSTLMDFILALCSTIAPLPPSSCDASWATAVKCRMKAEQTHVTPSIYLQHTRNNDPAQRCYKADWFELLNDGLTSATVPSYLCLHLHARLLIRFDTLLKIGL